MLEHHQLTQKPHKHRYIFMGFPTTIPTAVHNFSSVPALHLFSFEHNFCCMGLDRFFLQDLSLSVLCFSGCGRAEAKADKAKAEARSNGRAGGRRHR